MSFLSIEFSLFFFIFLILYWIFIKNHNIQNVLLLIASYLFLSSYSIFFAFANFFYALIIYFLGRLIFKLIKFRKIGFIFSIIIALSPLITFKYLGFIFEQLQDVCQNFNLNIEVPIFSLIIPIGLSFYVFNGISYLASIYRYQLLNEGKIDFSKDKFIDKEKNVEGVNLFETLLLLSFFPIILAGPLCRTFYLLPQFRKKDRFIGSIDQIITLVIIALIKKLWIASFLGNNIVDPIFNDPAHYNSLELIAGLFSYSIQLYFDFSGYTDLVIALGLMLGFKLPINFNAPYFARNLKEFWNRWHISLSHWIRDYIYIPLGGNVKGFFRSQINVMVAMILSGIWHGVGWNFFIWGSIHGIGVVFIRIFDKANKNYIRFPLLIAQFITIVYVTFAWLFFRSVTFDDSINYLLSIKNNFNIDITLSVFGIYFILLLSFLLQKWIIQLPEYCNKFFQYFSYPIKLLWLIFFLIIIITCAPSGIPQFIYANF